MIKCIGDSHCSLFNGEENTISVVGGYPSCNDKNKDYRTFNIGPALAYNTSSKNHNSNIEFNKVINNFVNKDDIILISLGQIDCSVHLPKQKLKQSSRQYNEIIVECAKKYSDFIIDIYNKVNNKIIIYGPVISGNKEVTDYKFEDKILAVTTFTKYLNDYFKNYKNIYTLSLLEYDVFFDKTHLSSDCFPGIDEKINGILNGNI